MNRVNLVSRIGAVSDKALRLYISESNKIFCLLTYQSTSILSNPIDPVDIPSVAQPTATNLYATPPEISATTPVLSIVSGRVSDSFVARVLARLSEAELKAPLADRDDIRVAWITVLKADEGHPTPFVQAFFQYFGESPAKLIPFLAARADINRIYAQAQAAWLEKYLPFRHHNGWRQTFAQILAKHNSALPPKKPAASVPFAAERKKAA